MQISIQDRFLDCGIGPFIAEGKVEQWEKHYAAASEPYSVADDWWRLSIWSNHLFDYLPQKVEGLIVVDVGCGTASRVATICPVKKYGYTYIGVDSSLTALKKAAVNIPTGLFIHSNLDSLHLRAGVVDVVLCLGVLMYFENNSAVLDRLINGLKPGGLLFLHEQVSRKSWSNLLGQMFSIKRESYPDAYGIQLGKLCDYLATRGTIVHLHLSASPIRKLLIPLSGFFLMRYLRVFAAWLDSVWCATVGRLFPTLGAGEVQLVFRKT